MKKAFFALGFLLLTVIFAFGQNEQSPIVEKEISYKDWTYKNVLTGEDVNLRDFTKGKKLTMVVYTVTNQIQHSLQSTYLNYQLYIAHLLHYKLLYVV